jgi:hypothetical protein
MSLNRFLLMMAVLAMLALPALGAEEYRMQPVSAESPGLVVNIYSGLSSFISAPFVALFRGFDCACDQPKPEKPKKFHQDLFIDPQAYDENL